jgi:hypothetical protein
MLNIHVCEQERNMHLGMISKATVTVAKFPKYIKEIRILCVDVLFFFRFYDGADDSPVNSSTVLHIFYTWQFANNKSVHMIERTKVGQHRV